MESGDRDHSRVGDKSVSSVFIFFLWEGEGEVSSPFSRLGSLLLLVLSLKIRKEETKNRSEKGEPPPTLYHSRFPLKKINFNEQNHNLGSITPENPPWVSSSISSKPTCMSGAFWPTGGRVPPSTLRGKWTLVHVMCRLENILVIGM